MAPTFGILVPCSETLRFDLPAFADFIGDVRAKFGPESALLVLSLAPTRVPTTSLRPYFPRCYLTDTRFLSTARMARLCPQIFAYARGTFTPRDLAPAAVQNHHPRFCLAVGNGNGLGHVMRMRAFAKGLAPFGPCGYLSYSAALVEAPDAPVFFMPGSRSLHMPPHDALPYEREGALRFFNAFNPTHVFFDGNIIPAGLLAALAARPHVHFSWVRRGMWPQSASHAAMAQQALADLVIEPSDFAEARDKGPSWQKRLDYCPPPHFLKIPPVRFEAPALSREAARAALGLEPGGRLALIMLGTSEKADSAPDITLPVAQAALQAGFRPVIAHWPVSPAPPPVIEGATVLERMPLSPYYNAFDAIVSAAGYNSFHELLAGDVPVVFLPQEDENRDCQIDRAVFAQEAGLARLCRRDRLDSLASILASVGPARPLAGPAIAWMNDWAGLLPVLGLSPSSLNERAAAAIDSHDNDSQNALPPADAARLFRRLFKRARRQYAPSPMRLVLALGLDYKRFSALFSTIPASGPCIVVCDSMDPVALRRLNLPFLYVNRPFLSEQNDSLLPLTRQILTWLYIWKPSQLIDLSSKNFSFFSGIRAFFADLQRLHAK